MNPFVAAHVQAMIESIRLLEAYVTAPLGLYSDIKMLRETLKLPEAAELSREELRERRTIYGSMTDDPSALALETLGYFRDTLDILSGVKGEESALDAGWVSRARMVTARAIEQVGSDARDKIASSKIKGLYVIVDPEATKGRDVLEVAQAALEGGASVLQLRDKQSDKGEALSTARKLKELCDAYDALFIMNDDADIAALCGSGGLHVGQTDLPIAEARRVLSPRQLVGRSNNNMEEAMASQAQGADYIAVGAVFPTSTMGKGQRQAIGVDFIRQAKERVTPPVVTIGGINAANIAEVARAGADCICVVSAVTFADDPERATKALVEAIQNAK